MGPLAQQYIETSYQRGYWVMLQNCHLLPSWLKTLAKLLEGIHKPHKDFRLWLTTQPTDEFPMSILQRSLKVVTEAPDDLRQNLLNSYCRASEDLLQQSKHLAFPSLVYVLSFFHAVIQERRKYGKIGWNVAYDFNEADLSISTRLLAFYLDKAVDTGDPIPWSTLRYLIGEVMYGGRVTDSYDRRALNTYLEEYLGDFLFDSYQPFYFCRKGYDYAIPPSGHLLRYSEYIKEMPTYNGPEVFGLHANAEIGYFVDTSRKLWENILKLNVSSSAVAPGGSTREDSVGTTAAEIQEKLAFEPLVFETEQHVPTPTEVVLKQEIERFNLLTERMRQSLTDLQKALKGEIGMSVELESLSNSLVRGSIPKEWARVAPSSMKPLASWVSHFLKRYEQYTDWIEKGAGWDFENKRLTCQRPKELTVQMPLIQVVPVEMSKSTSRNCLRTPVYSTQNRSNAMGEGWVFDATLPIKQHQSLWILAGVCLVLQDSY
ncbi:UNVERIFIED_CONTAM: hypothetical protein H355_014886 [Colinus virginianus]|nr:hypothetical protein H355_014886 [Colinus virginianus]